MDNKQGAEDAVNYLHRMGYEKTILLVENRITMFERKRIQGFQAAIGLNGKDVAENLIVECGVESNQIGEAIQRALNKYPDIDSNVPIMWFFLRDFEVFKKEKYSYSRILEYHI